MDLSVRSTLPEEMNDENVDIAAYQRCLAELAVINRVTFTHRPALHWLAHVPKTLPVGETFFVRDIETIDAELRGAWLATLNGCSPSTVHTERAARRANGSALAFGRKTETFRKEPGVRDIETIDAELRLLVRAWRVARVLSDRIPSTAHIDELLDERAAAIHSSKRLSRQYAKGRVKT
jgi:hypothetical protein